MSAQEPAKVPVTWKAVVAVLGAANVAFGLVALAAPDRIAGFVGLGLASPSAHGEVRAVFGGLVVALGLLMIAAPLRPEGPAWLRALACGFAGLVLGRGVSLATDGIAAYTLVALLIEAATAAVLALAARSLDRARSA